MARIRKVGEEDFEVLTVLWERSVRATHDFLAEQDIVTLRPAIRHEYLPALTLFVNENEQNQITGFVGVSGDRVEALFVDPDVFGQGVGKRLLIHAVAALGARALDVNEQNPRALAFYRHMGFNVIGRSALDGQGNPFPLLHMMLKQG